MVKPTAEDYLDVKQPIGFLPAAGREVDSIGPCCLDVNTKTAFLAKGREGGIWMGIWIGFAFTVPAIAYGTVAGDPVFGLWVGLFMSIAMIPFSLRLIYSWRKDVPMRFNRHTRKVYFQHRGKLYTSNWDGIRAYLNVQPGVVYGGGRVRDPQVNIEFEDEKGKSGTVFLMATRPLTMPEREAAASLWEYIRLYMEEGPEVLPEPQVPPRYDSLAEMRRDLTPFPLPSNARRSWLADLLLFFPFRLLWFAITYPTEIIYRFIADRIKVVPLLPEMEKAGQCNESEETRRKRVSGLLSAYDERLQEIEHELERSEQSLLFHYYHEFVKPSPPPRVIDGIPEGWYRVPLTDLVEFNPWHQPKRRRQIHYVPLEALPKSGMILERDKLQWLGDQTGRTFRNGDTLIPAVSPWLENGRVGFVDFLKGYDLSAPTRTFLQRLNGYEIGVGSNNLIVMRGTKVSPGLAYCIAKDPRLQEYARMRMKTGSGTAALPVSALAEFELPMPPIEAFRKFEKYTVRPFLRGIVQLAAERHRLLTARKQLIKNCP